MKTTGELLEFEIYPTLFNGLDKALSEFSFKRIAKGWQSTNGIKIDGSSGEAGKVYCYENNISQLIDYTRGSISIWGYIQQRDNLTNKETLLRLAQLSEVTLPEKEYTPEELERIEEANKKAQIWEDANDFFIECLSHKDNKYANSSEAVAIRKYLEDRSYTKTGYIRLPGKEFDLNKPMMELGYLPTITVLKNYLLEKHTQEDVDVFIKSVSHIGSSHTLTIPYRNHAGRMQGIAVRNIRYKKGDKSSKYLYSEGLRRNSILFNLKAVRRDKDLIIVEGLFDALHPSVTGVENVVALGGTTLSSEQIQLTKKLGAKTITLCLDNDTEGQKAIEKALYTIFRDKDLKAYVAEVPEDTHDPDQLVKEKGADALKEVIKKAKISWQYLADQLLKPYENEVFLDSKDLEALKDKIIETATVIPNTSNKIEFREYIYRSDKVAGLYPEALEVRTEEIEEIKAKYEQEKQLKELLKEVESKTNKGKFTEALELLDKRNREIRAISKKESYESLLTIPTEKDIRVKLSTQPDSLKTKFTLYDEAHSSTELCLPSGALSIFAGRTTHGKTAMLMNLALDIADNYSDKDIHFFSYEEDREIILLKLMNIFINEERFRGDSTNYQYIKGYYRTSGETYTNPEFLEGKRRFYEELITTGRLRVHYVPYDVNELVEAIRYIHSQKPVGAVFIDYLQMLGIKGTYGERYLQLQAVCNKLLNDLAVPTGIPIILGAQFNREVKEESDLDLNRLREAGDIEQTANIVLGIWNRGFSKKESKDKRGHFTSNKPNEIYVELLKNRDGQVGLNAVLEFNGNTGKISNEFEKKQEVISIFE